MTLGVLSGCGGAPPPDSPLAGGEPAGIAASAGQCSEIVYRGGPVMTAAKAVYLIWYGAWNGNPAVPILTDLASNIGGSRYFAVNASYTDNSGRRVSNAVTYGGSTTDNYSQSGTLSEAGAKAVVQAAVQSGRLPSDTNGIYVILTSADVQGTFQGLTYGVHYCGYHWHGNVGGSELKYALVGNPANTGACQALPSSPNGNIALDNMASIFAHELSEAVTDPLPDTAPGWGSLANPPFICENADACKDTYGNTYWSGQGLANTRIGNRDYLIQQNWLNNGSGSYCAVDLVPQYFNSAQFAWQWLYHGQNWGERYDLVPGDFNGDGLSDLYLHSRQGAHEGDYLALSSGAAYAWSWIWPYGAVSWEGYDVIPGDFNGDGKTDIYLHGRPGTGWGDYMGLSNGTNINIWNWYWPLPGQNWNSWEAVPGDFNGDGRTDMLMHGRAGTQVSDFLITSTGTSFNLQAWSSPYGSWSQWQVVTGDFNGDHMTDIYLHARPGTHLGDYMGTSNGAGFNVWTWPWPYGAGSWDSADAFAADFNGDGKSDLFLHGRPGTGWGDYMGTSTGYNFNIWTWQSYTTWNDAEISLADFNGDGKADIYVHAGPNSNDVDHIVVPSGGAFNGWSWNSPSSWRDFLVVPRDYDGNRHADIYLHGRPNSPFGEYMLRNPIP